LPEPDNPVITTKACLGMSRSMFFRLWVRAPRTEIKAACFKAAWEGVNGGAVDMAKRAGRQGEGNRS
jgi:hypothetical protein